MHTPLAALVAMLLLAACVAMPGASGVARPAQLTVFAAASLKDAFETIAADFEAANPDTDVIFNLGGSQALARQLAEGAPADVFASANARQMQVAVDAGRVVSGAVQTFVGNRLVIVVPADNPAGVQSLDDLSTPGIKLVLADAAVPVGEYSLEVLAKAAADPAYAIGFAEAVVANIVSYEENVRSVLNKVLLGEADAGIVYTSDVTPDVAEEVTTIAIADALNVLATYPIATVADAALPEAAQAFVDLVLSPRGQTVLGEYGFIPVESLP